MSRRSAPLQRTPSGAHDLVVPARAPLQAAGRAAAPTALRSNQALQRLATPALQARLEVGAPGDAFEREAEATADRILRAPQPQERRKEPEQRGAATSVRRKGDSERKRKPDEERSSAATGALQRAAAPPQRKEPPEKQRVRRSAASRLQDESFTETLRARHDGEAVPAVSAGLERTLRARRGGGRPLSADERGYFEPRFGHDLGAVRLHTDDGAAQAAAAMNARAFTYGNEIYFAAGRYRPDSDAGRHLMAHELTHTLQQGGADGQVQRLEDEPAPVASDRVDRSTSPPRIQVPRLEIPQFKKDNHPTAFDVTPSRPLYRAANYRRGNPGQAERWDRAVNTGGIAARLRTAPFNMQPARTYLLQPDSSVSESALGGQPRQWYRRIGGPDQIAEGLKRPFWWSTGRAEQHQVDHIVELQMAGWPRADWANELPNMEMLNAAANSRSGTAISESIETAIQAFIDDPAHGPALPANRRSVHAIKTYYDVRFDEVVGADRLNPPGGQHSRWIKTDVEAGAPLQALADKPAGLQVKLYDLLDPNPPAGSVYSPHTFSSEDLLGSSQFFRVYNRGFGGGDIPGRGFRWSNSAETERARTESDPRIRGFAYTHVSFNHGGSGEIAGSLRGRMYVRQTDGGHLRWSSGGAITWPIKRVPGTPYAGYLDYPALRQEISNQVPESPHASPISIDEVQLDERGDLVSRGVLGSTIPLFRELGIDLVIAGDDIRLEKAIDVSDFQLPRPLQVRSSTLVLSLGTETGLGASGRVEFGIDRVGEGYIEGGASTGGGLYLAGGFSFDSRVFNPAEIAFTYQERELSGSGRIGIPEGRLRGIRSAVIEASYRQGRFEASGNAQFSIPGVQQGTLSLVIDETEGMQIGGRVDLANDIPGIRSGSIEAQVRKPPDSDEYLVSALGTAVPAIPGVDATLTVEYDNGALTIEGEAAYARGMLSGSVRVGATNRPLDAQGNPLPDAPPADALRAYGGGEVTIRIAPWLQGTAGLRLLPNGEIEVSGSIGLPSAIDVFPEKRLDRNVFDIGLDIPIVGVAVAGQRIGIFATIRGGLDVSAGIGPGQLRELALGITYNPAHEDQTRVTGDARLVVPAQAGLRLFVRGGLGAGIPIVSATAALEIGGSLGLEGAVEAGVHVDWSPASGLAIDAEGEIYVQPKFKFDVTGMVLVEADLLVTTVELYSQRWNLAQFEYGSDLRFGVRFPIRYREGQPFDIALSDVQFDVPEVDPQSLLGDLIDRIA